ncbi:MAG: FAD-dependent oxidoreductase, partial [Rhizobacter sp.]|nr:FAD-dependent oxidoreductase [Burkholderiales bacterium]
MSTVELKVPDIGDYADIPVIEVLVKVGDSVVKEQSLVTLESDKATMEVPADTAGVVKEIRVKLGDKVSMGTVVAVIEAAAVSPPPPGGEGLGERVITVPRESVKASPPVTPPPSPQPPAFAGAGSTPPGGGSYTADIECEMLVLGAGPGGYSAAFRAADLGMQTVLIERYATLGGVCLNVGCIPSKALLHTASVMDEVKTMAKHGITFGAPVIDMARLRDFKNGVVKKLTGGLAGMAKARKVDVVRGVGKFLDAHHVEVEITSGTSWDMTGEKKVIKFQKCIIAAGSQAVKLPFMPEDPRVVDSTGALLLEVKPER